MPDDKIHVALAVYDPRGSYSRHAGVVLASMFSNTSSPVCAHILHDETLSDDNRRKLLELAAGFGQELDFVSVSDHIEGLRAKSDIDRMTRGFSRGSLYRLFIQDVLPLGRVIYLDCDVVVELDIKEFWDIELGGREAGAVLDEIARARGGDSRRRFFYRYAGIDVSKYFSSGALILNLERMRERADIRAEAAAFFQRYPHTPMPDMDFLNKIFQDNILLIDRKFNYYGSGIDYSDMKGKLWHLAGKKPWDAATGSPTDALYWRYFALTPWCGDLAAEITGAWAGCQFIHIHSSDCLRTLLRNFAKIFSVRNSTPLFIIAVIWHDIVRRITRALRAKQGSEG